MSATSPSVRSVRRSHDTVRSSAASELGRDAGQTDVSDLIELERAVSLRRAALTEVDSIARGARCWMARHGPGTGADACAVGIIAD